MDRTQSQSKFKNIHLIYNPAAGQEDPPLDKIKSRLKASKCRFSIKNTDKNGNISLLVQEALDNDADLIIGYGGDGTILEISECLINKDVPLCVIPGGTANVFATELGIPTDSVEALNLVFNTNHIVRNVDVGCVGERFFLLRLGIGLEAAMTVHADDDIKKNLGVIAYIHSAISHAKIMKRANYHLNIDGVEKHIKGVTCVICNSGNLGLPGIQIIPEIDISDGKLNIIVLKYSHLRTIFSILFSALSGFVLNRSNSEAKKAYALYSWEANSVTVKAEPSQLIAIDGEELDVDFPLTVSILPRALKVLVPKDKSFFD